MDFKKHQEELEYSFILDCNPADLKENKEAKKALKVIQKQKKLIDKFYKKVNRESYF